MSSFVTYAQNFEDVILWRAFKSIADGFYIDVGAADPDEDSVTRAFYDRGWHGINVEPTPEYFDALLAARPRDITLRVLVGATTGEARLHHFADTGLSTMDENFAGRHVAEGRDEALLSLPVLTLTDICRRHAPGQVHFLKIDVEGAEADVLRGANFNAFRPWVVLAEATEPGSQTENWFEWEGLLTAADYRFAWFDGLNRFYVAVEHWEALRHAFTVPPNVFDQWIQPRGKQQRVLLAQGETQVKAALSAASASYAGMVTAQEDKAATRQDLAAAQAGLDAVKAEAADLHARLAESQLGAAIVEREAIDARERLRVAQTIMAASREKLIAAQANAVQARGEVDRLHAMLARERAELVRLQADIREQRVAREQAEAALATVFQSRSWRIAAPLRGFGGLLRGRGMLSGLKSLVRIGIFGFGRLAAWAPGGRAASGILRRLLPRVHAWLYDRYRARHNITKQQLNSGAPMLPEPVHGVVAKQAAIATQALPAAEESRIVIRLRAQTATL